MIPYSHASPKAFSLDWPEPIPPECRKCEVCKVYTDESHILSIADYMHTLCEDCIDRMIDMKEARDEQRQES